MKLLIALTIAVVLVVTVDLFTWHPEQGGVPVGGAKSEVNPNVIVGDKTFEFTAEYTSARVGVRW